MSPDERDAAMRDIAGKMSTLCLGMPVQVSVGSAALFIVAQSELVQNPEFSSLCADKLRAVADLIDPKKDQP